MGNININNGDMLANVTGGIIVHGCNAQGVMGSGIALSIKNKWPEVFNAYRKKFLDSGLILGEVIYVKVAENLIVANAITQEFYKGNTSYADIRYTSYDAVDKAFADINKYSQRTNLPIHYPLIGAVRGGGNWDIISKIISCNVEDESYLWVYP